MLAVRLVSRSFVRQTTSFVSACGRNASFSVDWGAFRIFPLLRAQGSLARGDILRKYSSASFRDRRRFYEKAGVRETENGFQIELDNKAVKTPAGNPLLVPSEQLAMAIAVEWNSQQEIIKSENMHLTSLSNTVIDVPRKRTKAKQVDDILEFLLTDTICFHAEEPEQLVELQNKEWSPLLEWFCDRFQVSVSSASTLMTVDIPESSMEKLKEHLTSVNHWALTGLEYSVETVKSLVISLALVENHVSVERAAYLARLELEFQIEKWGSVEWAHDVDLMEVRSRLAAAALFYHLTAGTTDR